MRISRLAATSLLIAAFSLQAEEPLRFETKLLHVDNNEGIAVADYDNDGKLDVSAGEFWYAAPDYQQRPLRKLGKFGADYLENNGEHAFDVDGDGWTDVVSGSFKPTEVKWYRNPGKAQHSNGQLWEQKVLVDTKLTQNEVTFFHDVDGDGTPEFVTNSWNRKNPFMAWQFAGKGADRKLEGRLIGEAGETSNGHGAGFGDVNGDGREDVVFGNGWYERPEEGAFAKAWTYHPDFVLPHASCPILVLDLNGDSRKDLIWADGHDFGLYWEEQLAPDPDGTTNWKQHLIDKTFSQGHALAWADLDKDGRPELITGKRVRAHSGKDPGATDEPGVYYYDWDAEKLTFQRTTIATGSTVGIGLQIRVADLDGNGWPDLALSGKSGTNLLFNQGR